MARRVTMASVVTAAALAVLAIGVGLGVAAVGAGKTASHGTRGSRRSRAAVSGRSTFAGPMASRPGG